LRQLNTTVTDSAAYLFKPETAMRVRWDTNTDTPIPPDEPAGKNPPDGAIINYYLGSASSGTVTLQIMDSTGKVVRQYASTDTPEPVDPMLAIPKYWLRPPQILSSEPGLHRFLWDMHFPPLPEKGRREYPMQAIFHDTAPASNSPWVMPGAYTVKLTAGGKSYVQPLLVEMDPRVKTPVTGLLEQFKVSMQIYQDLTESSLATRQLGSLRDQLAQRKPRAQGNLVGAISAFEGKLTALEGNTGERFPRGRGAGAVPDTLNRVNGQLTALLESLQEADVAPTAQALEAVANRREVLAKLMTRWDALKKQELPVLNGRLKQAGLAEAAPPQNP
ncbi:MAG TPA: hypothetical protein VLI55_04450, partial [Bryobacteraceae bacterium]|nr:hypothetical protein [Bryobacteraceae bacterium]